MTTVSDKIDLLISDIDGTLVTKEKVLTPAAMQAAKDLAQAGIGLTLTSARPPSGMRKCIEALGVTLPLAGFNGGLIVGPDFQVLESYPIDPQAAAKAVQLVQESMIDLWVYTQDEWLVSALDGPHVAREAWIIDMTPNPRPCTPADLQRAFKIVGVSDDHAKIAAAAKRINSELGATVSATSSESAFIDVTHPQANKGAVVHAMARRLDIPPARIATIGDMANDVLMFAQSGFSIAMGNATDEVKAKASVVTDSNEQDGFAHAVQRFLLAAKA